MNRIPKGLAKFLYILPTALMLLLTLALGLVALLLLVFGSRGQNVFPAGVVLLFLLGVPAVLSVAGSVLLCCGRWWGCFFLMAFGILPLVLSVSQLLDNGHFGMGYFLFGAGVVAYDAFLGVLCKRNGK